MIETLYLKAKLRSTLFPHSCNKLFDFSFSRRASITPALDLVFPGQENIWIKLTVVHRLFASVALTMDR